MNLTISGYARAFEAHQDGITLYTDNDQINFIPNASRKILLSVESQFSCCHCKKQVKSLYAQAYCYPCSRALARCDLCVLKPELCHYAKGTCREPSWGEQYCMIPHVVYLAWTSDIKIGITKKNRTATRWREQGALMAAPLFETNNRYEAGLLEKHLRNYYKDATAWRKMLQCQSVDPLYFSETFSEASKHVLTHTGKAPLDYQPTMLNYPLHGEPKIATLASTKNNYTIQDALIGIKGHYLLFSTGIVSVRSWMGRHISYDGAEV